MTLTLSPLKEGAAAVTLRGAATTERARRTEWVWLMGVVWLMGGD